MKLKINSTIIIVSLIIILGLFLRTYKLGDIPAGFFCDEASIGYNAYSLLHTGKDEYSISFPIFFKAFGEYKNPIQIYSTVPFIAAFGLNEVAARLPSTIYGILCLIAIYALTNELFKHSKQKKCWHYYLCFFWLYPLGQFILAECPLKVLWPLRFLQHLDFIYF